MVIEYYINCFERILKVTFPDGYEHLKDEILKMLDGFYYEWHDAENIEDEEERIAVLDSCLEEYMMDRLSETYNMWEEWDTEYIGDDEEEMYETVPVKNEMFTRYKCKYCDFNYWDVDNDVEEALWGHIQMEHEDKFEGVQDWETPYMIEECYEEEM